MPTPTSVQPDYAEQVYRIADLSELTEHPRNPRQGDVGAISVSIERNGFYGALTVQKSTGYILGGNHRKKALAALGITRVPIIERDVDDETAMRILLADNRHSDLATYDDPLLLELLMEEAARDNLHGTGYTGDDIDLLLGDMAADEARQAEADVQHGALTERFLVPPFTVLDARHGYWQERKQQWAALGIHGEAGRGEDLAYKVQRIRETYAGKASMGGTSVFDPVLCEIAYRWFNVPAGHVLDPFAGESTKGLVAARLGYPYTGVELRAEQVAANQEQAARLAGKLDALPNWIEGDSADVGKLLPDGQTYDLVFTSPPYYDLETYSAKAEDGSAMPTYAEFLEWFTSVLHQCVQRLNPDRFVVLKVGEVRDKRGGYRNFVADTIQAMLAAGTTYYNEAILVTPVGTLPIRTGPQFSASRKLGKTHQNVLVFVKGDPKRATEAVGHVDFGDDNPPD